MKNARGMSLVEVVIAAAVLIIMVALLMTVFFGMSTSGANSGKSGDLAQRGRQTLDRLRDELQMARLGFTANGPDATAGTGDDIFGGVFSNHCVIRFQAPLAMNASGLQDWGCKQPPNTPVVNGYYELGFVGDTIIRESSSAAPTPDATATSPTPPGLDTILIDRDLNLDGDKGDAFVRGRIWQRAYTSAGTLLSSTVFDDYVLLRCRLASGAQVSPASLDGAINSDAEATGVPLDFSAVDPLYRILDSLDIEVPNTAISSTGRKVRVTLWHADFDHNERTLLRFRNQEDVRLENPQ